MLKYAKHYKFPGWGMPCLAMQPVPGGPGFSARLALHQRAALSNTTGMPGAEGLPTLDVGFGLPVD